MHEHELWFTALLNQYLAAPANALFQLVGFHTEDAAKPWSNYMAMELLVIGFLMLVALIVRAGLSVDRPGKLQLVMENIYTFIGDQAHEIIGHGAKPRVAYFSMIFLFVVTSNLLGIIPTFESPTMYYFVPAGLAIATFLYYNGQGIKEQGVLGHLKHFCGPLWWLAWFMFPLEIISHCIRPVSLTIRLFANMLAGEQVTVGFLAMVPWVVPVIFMGLHVFVSFVQAFIFMMLSMVYVGESVAHEEH
ncbi:F0F1 ATP synthase subunit A [uncultured Paludibaculum sp.]|uniref:F0F1 ATP synthase subunit A n=1 Tax=uncultured Paludibaculum sp. TaxID=1765020 RepID=UPI002AAC107E|nr:F0F1 ATP synthase subunit A [uncultured Paludibaculum sp.]